MLAGFVLSIVSGLEDGKSSRLLGPVEHNVGGVASLL